jgi:hypothetical protein
MIVINENDRINIDDIVKYFNIDKINLKSNLYLDNNLWFNNNKRFINYVYHIKNNKVNKKIEKSIIEDYKFKIFQSYGQPKT